LEARSERESKGALVQKQGNERSTTSGNRQTSTCHLRRTDDLLSSERQYANGTLLSSEVAEIVEILSQSHITSFSDCRDDAVSPEPAKIAFYASEGAKSHNTPCGWLMKFAEKSLSVGNTAAKTQRKNREFAVYLFYLTRAAQWWCLQVYDSDSSRESE
jgi:hypothetical protein